MPGRRCCWWIGPEMDWQAFVPLFLASTVEWVEAFTIVLAVSLTIGWGAAVGAAVAGLGTLGALTFVTGGALSLGLNLRLLQFIVGVFLLLFGVRWLAKAIARQAGVKALHDEDAEFAETRAALRDGSWFAAWLIAYKGVLLEGLEVWLLVVAFSLQSRAWGLNAGVAVAALALVCAAGAAVRAPLRRVPENAIKFLVGAMITAFGTFWTLEAMAPGAWPMGDWSLPLLGAFYLVAGFMLVPLFRRPAVRAGA